MNGVSLKLPLCQSHKFILMFLFSLSSKQGGERDQLEISTSTSLGSPTIHHLQNPYYGYGVHNGKGGDITDSGYSIVQKNQLEAVKEVDNPTYGLNVVTKEKELISNPLYGASTLPAAGVQLPSSSDSGLYSEVPTSREERLYVETKHM